MLAIIVGLVIGKPLGMLLAARARGLARRRGEAGRVLLAAAGRARALSPASASPCRCSSRARPSRWPRLRRRQDRRLRRLGPVLVIGVAILWVLPARTWLGRSRDFRGAVVDPSRSARRRLPRDAARSSRLPLGRVGRSSGRASGAGRGRRQRFRAGSAQASAPPSSASRLILAAMMKSFSCRPLILCVCRETVT